MVADAKEGNGEVQERPRPHLRSKVESPTAVYGFLPVEDITVLELAAATDFLLLSIAAMLGALPPGVIDAAFAGLPLGVQRHFMAKVKSGLMLPNR
jgi:hypothetical protein